MALSNSPLLTFFWFHWASSALLHILQILRPIANQGSNHGIQRKLLRQVMYCFHSKARITPELNLQQCLHSGKSTVQKSQNPKRWQSNRAVRLMESYCPEISGLQRLQLIYLWNNPVNTVQIILLLTTHEFHIVNLF